MSASTWLKCRQCGVRIEMTYIRPEWEGMGEQLCTCEDCEEAQSNEWKRELVLEKIAPLLAALDVYTKPGHHQRCSGPAGTCSCGFYEVMAQIRALSPRTANVPGGEGEREP